MSSLFHSPASRREFLRRSASLSALGTLGAPFALNLSALGSAAAQQTGDYKALVCLFLAGGNDGYNMVLPTDAASWSNYLAVRNQQPEPLSLRPAGTAGEPAAAAGTPERLGGVLPIVPRSDPSRSFALHPSLAPLKRLFDDGRLAILPNIGTLVQPLTKAQYKSPTHRKPTHLFSHNDQQSTWQTLQPEGAKLGWGGRLADYVAGGNANSVFTAVTSTGVATWLAGRSVRQYQVSTGGAVRIATDTMFSANTAAIAQRILRGARSDNLLLRDQAEIVGRSIDAQRLIGSALPDARTAPYGTAGSGADPLLQYVHPVTGQTLTNDLAQQFQLVARTIGARQTLGVRRQVFFVSLGGFDTHAGQNASHAALYTRMAHALAYFQSTLSQMGVAGQVTTFTASDFGRTFTSNGDGTDHGWGSHHFVLGGAVRGGDLYGRFPELGLPDGRGDFTSPDQLANGVLLPQTSVDQLGATLGRWFGVSDSQLLDVFPNLANFGQRDLGFMNG